MLRRFVASDSNYTLHLPKRKKQQRRTVKPVVAPTSTRTFFPCLRSFLRTTKVFEEVYLKLPSVLVSIDYGLFLKFFLPILEISLPLKEKKSLA